MINLIKVFFTEFIPALWIVLSVGVPEMGREFEAWLADRTRVIHTWGTPRAQTLWRYFLIWTLMAIIIPPILIFLGLVFEAGWLIALTGMLLAIPLTLVLWRPMYFALAVLIGVTWEIINFRIKTIPSTVLKFGEGYLKITMGILLWELLICLYLTFVPTWNNPAAIPKIALVTVVLALISVVWGFKGINRRRLIAGIVTLLFVLLTGSFFLPKTAHTIVNKIPSLDESASTWLDDPYKPSWWPSGSSQDDLPPTSMGSANRNPDGSWSTDVSANEFSVNSTIDVQKGQKVSITATGQVNSSKNRDDAAHRWTGPEGWNFTWNKKRGRLLGPYSPFMALCAKIGEKGQWFKVGRKTTFTAPQNGQIFFAINDDTFDKKGKFRPDWFADNQGKFNVRIKIGG